MAPVTMKVTPSSATCEKWSLLMSMNCGMNAPKNTSTLGLDSSTTNPCRKNPPRGGGGGEGEIEVKGHWGTRGWIKRQFDYARSCSRWKAGALLSLPLAG